MSKFNRNYILKAFSSIGTEITIELPFTVEFDIVRNYLSSANTASIRVYNLNQDTRNLLHKERFLYNSVRKIVLFAGYEKLLPIVFSGTIQRCHSVRQGTDFVTTFECFTAGDVYANSFISKTYPKDIQVSSIVRDLILSMKSFGLDMGAIGVIEGKILRGYSVSGNAVKILTDLTNGNFFIDNGKAYVLKDDETIRGDIAVISADTGLLNTPIKEGVNVEFEMLFEPRLIIGQSISLESTTRRDYNGIYKVTSVSHNVKISPQVNGQAITRVTCLMGENLKVVL